MLKPARKTREIYESVVFKCEVLSCRETFVINDHVKHAMEHMTDDVPCSLQCPSLQLFRGKAGLRSHIDEDCPKATVVCNKCD
jgi:hypothetical protein